MKRLLTNTVSLLVVVIVLFLILPLPAPLLDVLLVINIGLSVMILLITMNISDALDFSIAAADYYAVSARDERFVDPFDSFQRRKRGRGH